MTCRSQTTVYLGVAISKDCSWDAHIAKAIGKGKSPVGEMGRIVTNSHLDVRVKICILLNVIVPKLGCGRSMGREREIVEAAGNSTDDSS